MQREVGVLWLAASNINSKGVEYTTLRRLCLRSWSLCPPPIILPCSVSALVHLGLCVCVVVSCSTDALTYWLLLPRSTDGNGER
jgi:hypothetical protein